MGRRRTRFAIGTIFAANGSVVGAWAVRVADVQASHHLADSGLGFALISVGVGAMLGMAPTGRLLRRFGSRRCAISFIALLAAGPALSAATSQISLFVLGLVALGAGNGGLDVTMSTQGVHLEALLGRPVMSTLHAIFSVGYLASALCGGLIAGAGVSAAPHLVAVGGVAVLLVLVTSRWLIDERIVERAQGPVRWTGGLLALGAIAFCALFTEGAITDWGAIYVRSSLSGSAALAGLAFGAFATGMALSRLSGDRFRARFGPVPVVLGGALSVGFATGAALVAESTLVVVPSFALVGLGVGNTLPITLAAAGRVAPRGAVVATISTVGFAGFLMGPAMIGFVAGATSLPLGLSLVVLASLVILALAREVAMASPSQGAS